MTNMSRVLIVTALSIFPVFAVAMMGKAPSVLAQNYTDPENQKNVNALENRCTDSVYREENPLACRVSDAIKLIRELIAKGVSQHCIDRAIFGSGVFGNDTVGKLAASICEEEVKNGRHRSMLDSPKIANFTMP